IILAIMDVIIGKWKEKLPFLKLISPGSFPTKVSNAPINKRPRPANISIFPIGRPFTFLSQNVDMFFRLQLCLLVYVVKIRFVATTVHTRLLSSALPRQLSLQWFPTLRVLLDIL